MSVLYINEYGTSVGITADRIQVRRDKKLVQEIPAIHIERVVMMVPANITQPAVRYFMERGVDIVYLSQNGKYYGQFMRGAGNHVQIRLAQFRCYHDKRFRLKLAGEFVRGKVQNLRRLWSRQRRRGDWQAKDRQLGDILAKLPHAKNLDALRGHEGAAAAIHFRLLRTAIGPHWKFHRRVPHPPPDPFNAMLSLGYMLLYTRMAGLLQLHGLDPYLGFFHEPKRDHAALASDLIEEWRCPIVDALLLQLISRKQITPDDFVRRRNGCRLQDKSLRRFAEAFESQLLATRAISTETTDPVPGLEGQVRLLIRVLLGVEKSYTAISI